MLFVALSRPSYCSSRRQGLHIACVEILLNIPVTNLGRLFGFHLGIRRYRERRSTVRPSKPPFSRPGTFSPRRATPLADAVIHSLPFSHTVNSLHEVVVISRRPNSFSDRLASHGYQKSCKRKPLFIFLCRAEDESATIFCRERRCTTRRSSRRLLPLHEGKDIGASSRTHTHTPEKLLLRKM